jgi:subtilisin family serine protease
MMGSMPRRGHPALAALCLACLAVGLTPSGARAGGVGRDDPADRNGLQWGLAQIGAPAAWARSTGAGVTIAVVDSGVDLAHEDLRSQLVGDVSCIGASGDPDACDGPGQDDSGHGTHVAGIAAADAGNGHGIVGVAPDADLLAVRVLADRCQDRGGCSPTGATADVAAGVRWAVGHGADIVNLSLGGALAGDGTCVVCDAVEDAWARGVITVVAAGSDAPVPTAELAAAHAVLVTATTRTDALASYAAGGEALRGARWAVAAPGGETEVDPDDCATGGEPAGVLSTYWVPGRADGYACQAGTSMAAPHVSGALAVLLGQGRSPRAAVERLVGTAHDVGSVGRIDLGRAVGDEPDGASITSTDGPDPPASVLAEPLPPAPFVAEPAADDGLPRSPLVVLAVGLIVAGAIVRRRVRSHDHAAPTDPTPGEAIGPVRPSRRR